MTDQHPITPPPELIAKWAGSMCGHYEAARWGADQELEACCEWFQEFYKTESWIKHDLKHFRSARRPTSPPSLKEEAIDTLHLIRDHLPADMYEKSFLIRRALEQLDD
jgi:hypothetical protein